VACIISSILGFSESDGDQGGASVDDDDTAAVAEGGDFDSGTFSILPLYIVIFVASTAIIFALRRFKGGGMVGMG
jgi:hypothetical protein